MVLTSLKASLLLICVHFCVFGIVFAQPSQQAQQICDTNIRQILFVIDVSGSMDGNRIYQAKKFAVKTVQEFSGRGINFGVLTFGGGCGKESIQMEQPFTSNSNEAIQTINKLVLRGGTPLGPAIEEAYNEILKSPEPDNSRVILLNDGANGCGDVGEILRRRKRDVPCVQFTAIGIELQLDETGRPNKAMADLQQLAAETNGKYVALEDVGELDRVRIAPGKPLEYTPSPPKPSVVAIKPSEPVREPQRETEVQPQPAPVQAEKKQVEPKREEPKTTEAPPRPVQRRLQFPQEPQAEPLSSRSEEIGKLRVSVKDAEGNDVQGFVSFRDAASNALAMELFAHSGMCALSVERGKTYIVSVDKPGYVLCDDTRFPSSETVQIDAGSKHITLYLCTEVSTKPIVQSSSYLVLPISLPSLLFYVNTDILLPESERELRLLSSDLRREFQQNPQKIYVVEGHTSDEGTPERNLRLSIIRAQAIARALRNIGIPETQIQWDGFGRLRPVADNSSEEGRQLNRRVEIRVKE